MDLSGNSQERITARSCLLPPVRRRFNLKFTLEIEMTNGDQNNLDIDPSMILLGLGYVTSLFVATL